MPGGSNHRSPEDVGRLEPKRVYNCMQHMVRPKSGFSTSILASRVNPSRSRTRDSGRTSGEVADDVDIESLGFAHKYDITGAGGGKSLVLRFGVGSERPPTDPRETTRGAFQGMRPNTGRDQTGGGRSRSPSQVLGVGGERGEVRFWVSRCIEAMFCTLGVSSLVLHQTNR